MSVKKTARKKASSRRYLTKRILASAARAGVRDAAERTMNVMGFTVVVHDGWVVKKFADGSMEKISRIKRVNRRGRFTLD